MMTRRTRRQQQQQQHPDPVTELKLRNVAAVDALRGVAMRQIDSYQEDLTDAQEDLARATGTLVAGEEVADLNAVVSLVTGRIARAEEGIRQQREVIVGLNGQLEKAIADAGLTDSDLAYLNLGDSRV